MKKRLQQIKKYREVDCLTLKNIGKKFGLTGERVRQLCKENNIIKPEDTTEYFIICKQCGKKKICRKHEVALFKYCCHLCAGKAKRTYNIDEEDTIEYNKKRDRIRARVFYHRHKKDIEII